MDQTPVVDLPFVIARAHVGEHRGAFVQVALGEPALDTLLAHEQPVHRLAEDVLVGVAQVELLGQRGDVPSPGGGELRGGVEEPLHDHGQHPVAFGRAFGGDEPVQAQSEQGIDVAVGEGAFDGEGVFGADEALALEDSAQGVDFLCRPVGEVGQCAFAHALALAPAFSQEDGGAGVAVGDGFDVHGNTNHARLRNRLLGPRDCGIPALAMKIGREEGTPAPFPGSGAPAWDFFARRRGSPRG